MFSNYVELYIFVNVLIDNVFPCYFYNGRDDNSTVNLVKTIVD